MHGEAKKARIRSVAWPVLFSHDQEQEAGQRYLVGRLIIYLIREKGKWRAGCGRAGRPPIVALVLLPVVLLDRQHAA